MSLAPELVVPLTAAGTLTVTLITMSIKQRWDRAAERRADAKRAIESRGNHEQALALLLHQRRIDSDRYAKTELIVLATTITRRIQLQRRLQEQSPREAGSLIPARSAQDVCLESRDELQLAIANQTIDTFDLRRLLLLVSHPIERCYLGVLFDISLNWIEFDTFHGTDPDVQILVGEEAAETAMRTLACMLRGDPPPLPSRSILRRLPASGGKAERTFVMTPWVDMQLLLEKGVVAMPKIELPERFTRCDFFVVSDEF